MKKYEKKLEELSKLEKGWNGHDALPISLKSIKKAKELLENIKILPVPGGTIQVRFSIDGIEVEIEISEDGSSLFSTCSVEEKNEKNIL